MRRQAGASDEIEVTPEMIKAADRWLENNREIIESGGSGDLSTLVVMILHALRADNHQTA